MHTQVENPRNLTRKEIQRQKTKKMNDRNGVSEQEKWIKKEREKNIFALKVNNLQRERKLVYSIHYLL